MPRPRRADKVHTALSSELCASVPVPVEVVGVIDDGGEEIRGRDNRGRVVDRHDGSLTLDSRPGHTTFRVRLPFKRDA